MNPGDQLAAKIAPALVAALEAREEEIIAAAGGFLARGAVRMVFPAFLREVPALAHVSLDVVSREFGSLTVNDFLSIFAERLKTL